MDVLMREPFRYKVFAFLVLVVYIGLSYLGPREMFSGLDSDGFYSQMSYAADFNNEAHALSLLHWFRLFVVLPFWLSYIYDIPDFFEHVLVLLYFTPIMIAPLKGYMAYLRWGLLFLPFILSFRASLCVVSITLLFLIVFHLRQSRGVLIYSSLLATLSSGVVFAWLLIVLFLFKRILVRRYEFGAALLVLVFCFGQSVLHKLEFFGSIEVAPEGVVDNKVAPEGVYKIVKRSTLYDAYVKGRFLKFYFYVVLLFLYMVSCFIAFKIGAAEFVFMLISLPGFLAEGLWVTSYIGVVLLFLLGVVLPYCLAGCKAESSDVSVVGNVSDA